MEAPELFRCPISMEVMEDPVTVSTGVTYDRRSIERWLFAFHNTTCPATMQRLTSFDLIPNLTLKRLISSWAPSTSSSASSSSSSLSQILQRDKLAAALADIDSTPFAASLLRTIRSCVCGNNEMQRLFIDLGGLPAVARTLGRAFAESSVGGDFAAFLVCEEAVAVLAAVDFADVGSSAAQVLLDPDCLHPVLAVLQRGSEDARLNTMKILSKLSAAGHDWIAAFGGGTIDSGVLKSLLDLLSDAVSTKLSSSALGVLSDVVKKSKNGRAGAVEVGAVCVLVELLPDSQRHDGEQILHLLKRLCECPEGRSAFAEHALAIPAVSSKMLGVSETASKLAVKVLWLVTCNAAAKETVVEEMLTGGAVTKLLGLLYVGGWTSAKKKAMKMVRMHGKHWRHYPCFPSELGNFFNI